jgi:uncharacterized protein YdeI (YjbR/CyaY-like superfamily)
MTKERHDNVNAFYAKSQNEWRKWLEKNHQSEKSVWLIIYKKDSGVSSVYYPEAVDEALCFGWVDSKPNKRDADSYYQFFAQRNPKSNWSGVNKAKVEKLIAAGLMTAAGQKMIDLAKQKGTWNALDNVEKMIVPQDLQALFNQNKPAWQNWEKFPPSVRRAILDWIQSAKRPETREKRMTETVELASKNIRANQYKPK